MKTNYRIVEVTYDNENVVYKVQKQTRLFWFFGPLVWKTYKEEYDGNFSSHIRWCYYLCTGDEFSSKEIAHSLMEELRMLEGANIKSVKVVD